MEGLITKPKWLSASPSFNYMKSQSQPYTLHLSSIYRRYYRTKLVSVRYLTTKVLFVRFYITENVGYNRNYVYNIICI